METGTSIYVSIITPSYNQGEYLEQTIQSVLNQTYDNIEYLVIDGGSTDSSADIIKRYEEKITYWISEPDKGQSDAINKGLKLATGNLVCWINSDDILYPNFVADRVQQFKENPNVDMIYGDIEQGTDPTTVRLRKGKQTNIKELLKDAKCPIPQQSVMWRRDITEKIGCLAPQWHVLLDREYFIRIAANGTIKYIPGPAAFFRNHKQSKSVAEKLKWAEELPKYYEMIFCDNIYHLSPTLLSNRNKCLSKIYLKCARMFAKAEKKQLANSFFLKAKKASLCNYLLNHCFRLRF